MIEPKLANSLLEAWQALRSASAERGSPFLPIDPEDLRALQHRIDVPAVLLAVLREGTPVDPVAVGPHRLLPTWHDANEKLQRRPAWPRHLLPLGTSGTGEVVLDTRQGHIGWADLAGGAGQTSGIPMPVLALYPDPAAFIDDLRGWVEVVHPEDARAVRSWQGLRQVAWDALEGHLGPGWHTRALFAEVRPMAEVCVRLQVDLRRNIRLTYATAAALALSPVIGGWVAVQTGLVPPWQGAVAGLGLIGIAPAWLLAQLRADGARLGRLLRTLPRD
jgi:hypothetical protein